MIVHGPALARDRQRLSEAHRARDGRALGLVIVTEERTLRSRSRCARRRSSRARGLPFLAVVAGWLAPAAVVDYPPTCSRPSATADAAHQMLPDGTLARHTIASLARLAVGFVIGNGLAIPLGIAIALNRHVAETARPVLTFLQSIAGIAWVPLAIIWFGIGNGAVVFVIANTSSSASSTTP